MRISSSNICTMPDHHQAIFLQRKTQIDSSGEHDVKRCAFSNAAVVRLLSRYRLPVQGRRSQKHRQGQLQVDMSCEGSIFWQGPPIWRSCQRPVSLCPNFWQPQYLHSCHAPFERTWPHSPSPYKNPSRRESPHRLEDALDFSNIPNTATSGHKQKIFGAQHAHVVERKGSLFNAGPLFE